MTSNPNRNVPSMASCDEDFSLLGDDNHHVQTNTNHHHPHHHILHQPYASHRFLAKSAPIHAPPQSILPNVVVGGEDDGEGDEQEEQGDDNETDSDFPDVNHFNENSNPFNNEDNVRTDQRTDREDHIDGINNNNNNVNSPYGYKRARVSTTTTSSSGGGNSSGGGGAEYRKDREEWSDVAIGCLLEAYTEKFTQLNRGNLRGRDWEEVAATVSERCEKQMKTVEQCKNKVDNLKKRYKLERQRMSNGGMSTSHWPWFKKMEEIVGNSMPIKAATDEDKGSVAASSVTSAVRQSRR